MSQALLFNYVQQYTTVNDSDGNYLFNRFQFN